MSRKGHCLGCRPGKAAIIASLRADGLSYRVIAERVGSSKGAVRSHLEAKHGITPALVHAIEVRQEREAETLLQKVEKIERNAVRLVEKAEASHDVRGAVVANRALLDVIRLLHEMVPSGDPGRAVDVVFSFAPRPRLLESSVIAPDELPEASTGIETQVEAPVPEVEVVAPGGEPESPEAKFVREGFDRLDRLREQDAIEDARNQSALIAPDPRRRGGF